MPYQWSRNYVETHTADSAGQVFNTVDRHYFRRIIYGEAATPVSDYPPHQELLQAVLHDTADRQLAACRLHNKEYTGTYIVASLLPDSPARFFGQPLTDTTMLQVYQEHHDLEFELLDKAKSEEELREFIYYNRIYTHSVATMLNVCKVQDRLRHDELCTPYHPSPTSVTHILSGLVYDNDEANEAELHTIVVGAQLDEDDEPLVPTNNTTGLPFDADRWKEFKKDIEYKSDTDVVMVAEEDFELPALAEPAPAAPVPDPQSSSPPDMPTPDPLNIPILASFPSLTLPTL